MKYRNREVGRQDDDVITTEVLRIDIAFRIERR